MPDTPTPFSSLYIVLSAISDISMEFPSLDDTMKSGSILDIASVKIMLSRLGVAAKSTSTLDCAFEFFSTLVPTLKSIGSFDEETISNSVLYSSIKDILEFGGPINFFLCLYDEIVSPSNCDSVGINSPLNVDAASENVSNVETGIKLPSTLNGETGSSIYCPSSLDVEVESVTF